MTSVKRRDRTEVENSDKIRKDEIPGISCELTRINWAASHAMSGTSRTITWNDVVITRNGANEPTRDISTKPEKRIPEDRRPGSNRREVTPASNVTERNPTNDRVKWRTRRCRRTKSRNFLPATISRRTGSILPRSRGGRVFSEFSSECGPAAWSFRVPISVEDESLRWRHVFDGYFHTGHHVNVPRDGTERKVTFNIRMNFTSDSKLSRRFRYVVCSIYNPTRLTLKNYNFHLGGAFIKCQLWT